MTRPHEQQHFVQGTVHIVVAVSYTHLDVYKRQGQLSGLNAEQVAGKFTEMLASPGVMTFWMVFVVVLGILVCAKGLQNGCLLYTSRCV